MKISFKLAAVAAAVISQLSVAQVKETFEIHRGEDGIQYSMAGTKQAMLNGKIEQKLLEQSADNKPLDIIIYLRGEQPVEELQRLEQQHQPLINDLSERLQLIEAKYRPSESLSEEKEREFMASKQAILSTPDKALTRSIKEEMDRLMDELRKAKGRVVNKAFTASLNDMEKVILSLGGKVTSRIELTNALGATVDRDLLKQLAEYPDVDFIYSDAQPDYEVNISSPSANFPTWHGANFDGYPYDFGVVDTGVQENHPAFTSGNIVFCKKPGSVVSNASNGDHGTHVAGIVASNNGTYKGTAPGTDSVIWANSGSQATTMANMQWMITGNCQGPEVVNHSLGYGIASTSDYNANDAFYDAFVQNYNVMVTKSTGNSGWSNTSPRITHPAPAYNLMAVANMNDSNTLTRTDDVRWSTSSVGPTVNGRRKPDITAPGTSIMSANRDWSTEADFIAKTGTSMAAPHVAGAIVLMEDGGNHTPMAQKAVLINTADAWDSNNTLTTADDAAVPGSLWDKSYGWGYIDMWESHFNRSDYFVSSVIPRNNNNIANDYKLYKGKMFNNEKATLVWQRRSNFGSGTNASSFNLSDLNLRLYQEGVAGTKDSDLDGDDNVHQVAANASIDAVIKVYSWSSSFDGATSESYALATEENFSSVSPPRLQIPTQSFTGLPFGTIPVKVKINNLGGVDTCSVTVTRGNVAGVSGPTSVSIGKIDDGGNGIAQFNLSASIGNYNIPFTARTTCYDETFTTSRNINLKSELIIIPPFSKEERLKQGELKQVSAVK